MYSQALDIIRNCSYRKKLVLRTYDHILIKKRSYLIVTTVCFYKRNINNTNKVVSLNYDYLRREKYCISIKGSRNNVLDK